MSSSSTGNAALPQSDQAGTAQSSNSSMNSSATTSDQTTSSTSNNATTTSDQSAANANAGTDATGSKNANGGKLPQTATPLPLLALLGMGSLTGGMFARRKK